MDSSTTNEKDGLDLRSDLIGHLRFVAKQHAQALSLFGDGPARYAERRDVFTAWANLVEEDARLRSELAALRESRA